MARFLILLGLLLCEGIAAQTDSLPPFRKEGTLPDFKLLQADGKTWFGRSDLEKGKPVMVMLFNPDCDHCQRQTWAIRQGIERLGDLQIVMSTYRNLEMMRQFGELYELGRFPSIRVGRDEGFFLIPYYRAAKIPLMALYDADWRLIDTLQGELGIDPILKALGR